MGNETLAQFIESSKVLIENARGIPELAAALAGYGYDEARLGEGAKLWAETEALVRKQAKEYGEQHEATAEADKARGELVSAYMKALKVARIAFSEDAQASAALKLYGPRKQTITGWLDQASTFYANLGPGSSLAPKMVRFGYTAAKLQGEAALVEGLRKKIQIQAKETGEAQAATAERDKKVRSLDVWVSELHAIAKVAFHESPQELEKLGLVAPNGSRRKKVEAAPATAKN